MAAITLFACQTVSAYDFEVGGIYYDFNTSDMAATVTHGDKKYTGNVVIPSSVTYKTKTLKVTGIGWGAFSGCTSLGSITIPNSVTGIERSAFSGCTSLSSITIPNSVTGIESWAFLGCTSLTSITIPNSVKMIYRGAFEGCTSLVSVTITPNSVTEIGRDAFSGCTSLTSITIPNSVTTIGRLAFSGCTSLSTVVLSENLTKIEEKTFQSCSQLTTISIPAHVTSIDYSAFKECESLQKLTLENSDQPLKLTGYSSEGSSLHPTYLYLGREVKGEYEYKFLVSDSVETLVFGNTYTAWFHPDPTKIKTIISKIEKPHSIRHFSNRTYIDVTLYVPKGTKALYESTDGWRQFFNIQEGDPTTGVASTRDDRQKVEVSRYDINGQRLDSPRKGINIVRYSDGTTAKIVVQ